LGTGRNLRPVHQQLLEFTRFDVTPWSAAKPTSSSTRIRCVISTGSAAPGGVPCGALLSVTRYAEKLDLANSPPSDPRLSSTDPAQLEVAICDLKFRISLISNWMD